MREYCIGIAFPPEEAIRAISQAAPPMDNFETNVNATGDFNLIFDRDSVNYFEFTHPGCGNGLDDLFYEYIYSGFNL